MSDDIIDRVVERVVGGKQNIVLDATVLTSIMACPRMSDFRFNLNLQQITFS